MNRICYQCTDHQSDELCISGFLFLTRTAPGLPERPVALGTQQQIGTFLASDGTMVIHPEPAQFFEVPIMSPPEDLNFIP